MIEASDGVLDEIRRAVKKAEADTLVWDPLVLFALPNELEQWKEWFPGVRILPRRLKVE